MHFHPVILGALLVATATALGSAFVFTFQRIGRTRYTVIIGFCVGMMAYSSIEMLNESHALAGHQPAFVSFLIGLAFFTVLNRLLPHAHGMLVGTQMPPTVRKITLLVGAITLHNIPEGFAVASAFANSVSLGWLVTLCIAVQDIPEGLMVSAPVAAHGFSARRSFLWGLFSGGVEFVAALGGFLFLNKVTGLTPWALGFSAGAMFYITFFELLPDAMRTRNRQMALAAVVAGLALAYGLAMLIEF